MFEALSSIFRSWLIHGTVSKYLLVFAFLPLLKGGLKDPSKTDSYRAIAGSSQILKLFDNVILVVWGHLLSSDSLQFGFKSGFSTTQCSYLVQEVAGHYMRRNTPVFVTCCDCSKAFDKCRFDILFEKLLARNIPAIVVRVLIFSYEKQTAFVKWGNVKSEMFTISNGTKQGAVLSPPFFALYLDDLIKELRSLSLGCHVGGTWRGATGYADDLILLAPTRSAMAKMLEVCERYANDHNITFSTDVNPTKSKTKMIYMSGNINNRQ